MQSREFWETFLQFSLGHLKVNVATCEALRKALFRDGFNMVITESDK